MQPEQHYRLTVRQGAAPGKVFDLARDVIVMGRDLKCDVVLNDPEVSRNHTRLTAQADGYVVEDLESTNGTFVNSQKVTAPRLLQPGDLLGLGENLLMEYTLGDSAAATIVMPSAQAQATSLVSPTPAEAFVSFSPPPGARDEWALLRDLIVQLRSNRDAWPDELACVHRWYVPQLERLYDDARIRQGDLTQLERIAEGFRSRERFLTELALDPPQATSGEAGDPHLDEDYLILSTMHSAKGQEWQSVHILNAVDGCIPSDLTTGSSELIEEERRLLYVAMTRARQHLHVLVPQRFYVSQQRTSGDRHVYASLTRFITPSMAEAFEWAGAGASTDVSRPLPGVTTKDPVDIAAALRSCWY